LGQIDRHFRLTNEPGGLGLSCTSEGLSFAGVPLLRKTELGFAPRRAEEIESLFRAMRSDDVDPAALSRSLDVIARALNRGDLAYAMTAAVLTRLPELDWEAAARLAKAEEQLAKYDADQPRDWHGRWTDGNGGAAESHKPTPGHDAQPGFIPISADGLPAPLSVRDIAQLDDPYAALESKYDDLGPVEFAEQVIQFGRQLERNGKNMSPDEQKAAFTEYAFLQDRLSFWMSYDYKPPEAQANLISAALSLYQGAVNGRIVSVGGPHTDIPQSMVVVAMGAMALDDSQPGILPKSPSIGETFENGPVVSLDAPPPAEEIGGIVSIKKVDGIKWNGGIEDQGLPWQEYCVEQDPNLEETAPFSKTFDASNIEIPEAVSAKTLNTLSVTYIRKPQSIFGRLRKYVDDVASYQRRAKYDIDLDLDQADIRNIQLAIPEYTSSVQWRYIYRAISYGRGRGVRIIVTRIGE
jgi:hypothetical protein